MLSVCPTASVATATAERETNHRRTLGRGMTVLLEGAGDALADAGTLDTRLGWTLLTDPDAGHTWTVVSRRVVADLIRRGCQAADAADLAQQAGLRALEREIPYSTPDQLLAWCLTVSRRLLVDDYRRVERRRHLSAVEERAGDVEEEALSSLRVQELIAALGKLSQRDREALLSTVVPIDRQESNRMAVRRFRARARLLKLMTGVIAAAWAAIRRVPRLTPASATVAAGCFVVASLLLPAPDRSSVPPKADRPAGATASESAPKVHAPVLLLGGRPGHSQNRATEPRISPAAPHARPVNRTEIQPQGAPQGVYVEQRPAVDGDRLACADHVPVIGHACTPLLQSR